jgi:hypothetical protein
VCLFVAVAVVVGRVFVHFARPSRKAKTVSQADVRLLSAAEEEVKERRTDA